jgi:hypothetical protein
MGMYINSVYINCAGILRLSVLWLQCETIRIRNFLLKYLLRLLILSPVPIYILSGALIPSTESPFASTILVPLHSDSRAKERSRSVVITRCA